MTTNIELGSFPSLHSDYALSTFPVLHYNNPIPLKERIAASRQRALGRLQFFVLCWNLFVAGWNDATTGPLIPRLREAYHVNFAIISLIFVFACIGFFFGNMLNIFIGEKFGFGKMMLFGASLQIVGYIIQSITPPFPVFVTAFVLNGIGIAVQDAQANGYVASYKRNPESKMAILHAAYGAGALCAPLVATQFAQMPRWSSYYFISLGFAAFNAFLILTVFKLKNQGECLKAIGQELEENAANEHGQMRKILSMKSVNLLAFFLLFYVGTEVTMGGWIVTFVIELRGGSATSAGYVSSGFFGGLMLGRVALLPVNKMIGERCAVYLYTFLALALEFVIWFVPSLVSNGIAVAIIGLLLGPIYPIAMNDCSRTLPKWVLTGAISWVAGVGQAGSALLPFVTGILAEKYGIVSLQPVMVTMMGLLLSLWTVVGIFGKRTRQD